MTIKQEVEKVFRDRGFEPREHSVRNIIGEFHLPTKPHVTAIGTSGGKTFTTAGRLEFLYKYGYIKSNQSVLIMAADKTILRGNFVEQFTTFFKDIPASFTWRGVANRKELNQAVEDDVNVIITLPQTINDSKKLELLKTHNITWFIQDEAHKWYFKKTIQRIIKTLKPKYQSLLTGTPFKFNAKKDDFIFDYTSVAEMYGKGYLSDFTAQVLHSSVELTKIDYVSLLGNLTEAKRFTENEVQESFNEVVNDIIKKLKLPLKSLTTTHNVTNNISSVFGKLEKTIIFTHGTSEANYLYKYLQTQKVGSLVSHSYLKVDDAVATFQEFKDNDDIKILVAVNRGKEGFDFTQLYNVIDMTYSQNFEVVMQMIGRILRKSDKIKNKYFFKVAPKNTAGYFKDWMNAMFMLFDNEWYSKYNGKNGFDIRVPNQLLSSNKPTTKNTSKSKSTKGNIKPQNLEFFNSLSFMQDNKWFKLDDTVSTVASTTLRRVFEKYGVWKELKYFTKDEVIPISLKYNTRKDFYTYDLRAWQSARSGGFLDEVCSHMKKSASVGWEYEDIKKVALKYKTTGEFIKDSSDNKNMYQYANNKGWKELFSHFIVKNRPITKDEIIKSSKKYTNKAEWRRDFNGHYDKARKLNILEDVTKHMSSYKINWDSNEILKNSKKYKTKTSWKRGEGTSVIGAAEKLGILDKAVKHMVDGRSIGTSRKKILEIDLKGNVINEYSSLSDAGKKSKFSGATIQRVLYGKKDSHNGLIWRYK